MPDTSDHPAIPVCVFAKPPIAGQVKTRLAGALGTQIAAELAGAMLRDVWSTVSGAPGVAPILAAAAAGRFPMAVPEANLWLQPPGDLGERIEAILNRALSYAPAAIAVGADTPLLSTRSLAAALAALARGDDVLGPCPDGGFYLLGVRESPPGWLAGVNWSTSETGAIVARRLEQRGCRLTVLEMLADVDTPADLAELSERFETSQPARARAPETYAFLMRQAAAALR